MSRRVVEAASGGREGRSKQLAARSGGRKLARTRLWVIPMSYPICSPSGRWPLSTTSKPSVSWKDSRERPASNLPPETHVPEESRGVCVRRAAPPLGVQGRLLEVKRCRERGMCNTGQVRRSVDFLKKCAGELPTSPRPTRTQPSFCMTSSGLAVSTELNLSALKLSRAWCSRQGRD